MGRIDYLEFIYNRMVTVHGENPEYDYMTKFKEIIQKLKNVAKPEGDSRNAYPKLSDVRAEWDKFIMKQKNLPSEFIGIVNRNFWDLM